MEPAMTLGDRVLRPLFLVCTTLLCLALPGDRWPPSARNAIESSALPAKDLEVVNGEPARETQDNEPPKPSSRLQGPSHVAITLVPGQATIAPLEGHAWTSANAPDPWALFDGNENRA